MKTDAPLYRVDHISRVPMKRYGEILQWYLDQFDFERGRMETHYEKEVITKEQVENSLAYMPSRKAPIVVMERSLYFPTMDEAVYYRLRFI